VIYVTKHCGNIRQRPKTPDRAVAPSSRPHILPQTELRVPPRLAAFARRGTGRPLRSRLQKPPPCLRRRHRTPIIPAKHPIPPARHHSVSPIANPPRHNLQQESQRPPQSAPRLCRERHPRLSVPTHLGPEFLQHKRDRIRPPHQPLPRHLVIDHHIHAIKIVRRSPMSRQHPRRQPALQRRKPKPSLGIPPQYKLHPPVAQPANPVIEKNRMRHKQTVSHDSSSR
jgi:hypothetical protein